MSVTRRARDDRGLAIVFTALLMVVLMVFAAFALDLGSVYSARRNDQNAADASVLAGAVSLASADATLAAQVKDSAEKTLGVTFSSAEWNSCGAIVDPDPVDTPLSGANCITRNGARTQLQVRIPVQTQPSVFGRVVGVNGFDHSAFAIAGLVSAGFGSVLPFGMPAGGSADGYACIKSGSGGTSVEPCGGSSSGNFGYVDFTYYGNTDPAYNTSTDCGNGGQRPRAANNMAVGVDHDLSKINSSPHGSTVVVDSAGCSAAPQTAQPNSMDTLTGNTVSQSLNPGIAFGLSGGNTFTDGSNKGRLARSSPLLFGGSGSMKNVAGTQLDNNPLWEFIPTSFPAGASVPASCHKSVFTDVLSGNLNNLPSNVKTLLTPKGTPERMRLLLQRCFTHYIGQGWNANGAITGSDDPTTCPVTGCTAAVFTRNSSTSDQPDLPDIQYTARFGYVPQLTTSFPSGNGTVSIATFRAIFFQRLLGKCNGNSCDLDFEPGVYTNDMSSVPADAEAITAFVFPANMLPNGLAGEDAPFAVGKNRFVSLIR